MKCESLKLCVCVCLCDLWIKKKDFHFLTNLKQTKKQTDFIFVSDKY